MYSLRMSDFLNLLVILVCKSNFIYVCIFGCVGSFLLCVGFSLVVVLTAVVSLVAEHRL